MIMMGMLKAPIHQYQMQLHQLYQIRAKINKSLEVFSIANDKLGCRENKLQYTVIFVMSQRMSLQANINDKMLAFCFLRYSIVLEYRLK